MPKNFVNAVKLVLFTLLITSFGSTANAATTAPFIDKNGNVIPSSIAEFVTVKLNGFDQSILIRSKDINKPVLLYLHGGPGGSVLPFLKYMQTSQLEDNFVMVQWDQRGTGNSYSDKLTKDDMHVENFVEDVKVLTDYLRDRFKQKKIFMLGHSWGSALVFLTIKKYPEKYHAYIGAG